MYEAMIKKDEQKLNEIHDDSFVLMHMTGMKQNKNEYINAIKNGILNYFSEQTDHIEISIEEDRAKMTGYSEVNAAVFGGGRHTWRLQLKFYVKRNGGEWKLCKAIASTW